MPGSPASPGRTAGPFRCRDRCASAGRARTRRRAHLRAAERPAPAGADRARPAPRGSPRGHARSSSASSPSPPSWALRVLGSPGLRRGRPNLQPRSRHGVLRLLCFVRQDACLSPGRIMPRRFAQPFGFQGISMPAPLSDVEKHQLDVIARVTPYAMGGHILNTTVMAVSASPSIPAAHLAIWCTYSYAIALAVLYRRYSTEQGRSRTAQSFRHAANRAIVYSCLLAAPWGSMIVLYLGGTLTSQQELILVALGVGMAASGTILLSALPWAAMTYMSVVLLPSAVKCLFFLNDTGYILLGVLSLSYWLFLAVLITKITSEMSDHRQADAALKESEARLQEALTAGRVVAFTWDPQTHLTQRSANAPAVLGFALAESRRPGEFFARVHPDDRPSLAAQ